MQQEAINTVLPGEPTVPERGTESLVETAGDKITTSRLLGKSFPELFRPCKLMA